MMQDNDQLKSLYMDCAWEEVRVDDFLVAVGDRQTNSVYHVAEVNPRPHPKVSRMTRYHMKVYKSDLITALQRDPDQQLHPMQWYKREKKKV